MSGLNHETHTEQQNAAGIVDPTISPVSSSNLTSRSVGSSTPESSLDRALNQSLAPDATATNPAPAPATAATSGAAPDDHDHGPKVGPFDLHVDLNNVADARGLNGSKVVRETNLRDNLGARGDILNPGGGNNVVIASGDSDIIRGTGGGFNTLTTGTGKDTIILGKETTNRIFDFDPATDRFALSGINPRDVIIAQGKNPGKGGLAQPLDSTNNALVIDKTSGHILASLPFVKASDLNESHFVRMTSEANQSIASDRALGTKTQRGNGQINGTQGRDRLLGGAGDDFLFVGDNGFKFNTARGGGGTEFPFKTDSPGTSELNLSLKNGVLSVNGSYENFDAAPLFSQGETTIDPNAKILNGSDPVSLVNGFLKVPNDVEGNLLSGTHLHFSPAGDSRGNFADATVVRFFENTPTDAKSGTIQGEFELTPEEQAALLAGNLYVNIHTNLDLDGDGRAGFPTGENRLNFNKDVVQFV